MSDQPIATQLIEGAESRLEIDAAEIKVITGPDHNFKMQLGVDSLSIGSSPHCDLVLHDPTVSARHAEVIANARGYFLVDRGSTNGIKIGSVRIERAPLTDGMRFRLGDSVLQVHSLGKKTSIPLGAQGRFGGMVVHSVKMRAVVAMLEQLASSDLTVLIEGETGTGKEVAAQALHARSPRSRGPFVVFDCGAVQPSLVAAELFGYERGAFSGADQARAGLLEEADGGTLFLDEIGELPMQLQPTLLGAIERKSSRRVGGRREISHDVRIVAATNRNLAEQVRAQQFRQDLYYRLAVAKVRLPPLRERTEDIPLLIDQFAREMEVNVSPELGALCASYSWPGNVRELKNTMARISAQPDRAPELLSEFADVPVSADLGQILRDPSGDLRPMPEARRLANDEFERLYIETALARADGQVLRAAELAGVSRRFIHMVMAKHDIRNRNR